MHTRHLNSSRLRLRLVAAILITTLALSLAAPTIFAAAQAADLSIQNPGFEGDYQAFSNDVRRLVAGGWSPWNVTRQSGEPSWSNIAPQYLPADSAAAAPGRIRSGQRAQEFYELYATFTAGIHQRVNVTSGTPLRFSLWANVWSSDLDNPSQSVQPGEVTVQVGIDPTGGTNGESNAIVWGSSVQTYDTYTEISVDAVANSSAVTLFVRAIALDPVRHNHVYLDDARLQATGGQITPASATPTSTFTMTPSPTVQVIVVSATPTPTASLLPGVSPSATFTTTPSFTPSPSVNVPTREGTIAPGSTTQPPPTRETRVPGPSNTPDGLNDLPGRVTHTVQRGDTVSDLAVRFNSRVDAIISVNGLTQDGFIVEGQLLTIPVPAAQPTLPPPTPVFTPTNTLSFSPPTPSAPVLSAVLNGPVINGIGTYIMQPGDTLEAVAQRYQVTLQELAGLNGIINPRLVVIGQVLAVPGPGNNRNATPAPTIIPTVEGGQAPATPGVRAHTVQPGENLFRISLRYNVSMVAIMQLNGILNPNLVYAGQVLRLP